WNRITGLSQLHLPGVDITAFALDSTGRVWECDYNNARVLNDASTPEDMPDDSWFPFYRTAGCSQVLVDAGDRVWFVGELFVDILDFNATPFDKSDDQWVTLSKADGLPKNLWAGAIDPAGNAWFSGDYLTVTNLNGTLNKADDQWQRYHPQTLPDFTYYAPPTIDAANRVWIGLYKSYPINETTYLVLDFNATPFDPSDDHWSALNTSWTGAAFRNISDISPAPDGTMWFTAAPIDVYEPAARGVHRLDHQGTLDDPSDDTWVSYSVPGAGNSPYVNAAAITSDGAVFLGATSLSELDIKAALYELDLNATPANQTDDTWITYRREGFATFNIQMEALGPDGSLWLLNHDQEPPDNTQYWRLHVFVPGTQSGPEDEQFATLDLSRSPQSIWNVSAMEVDSLGRVWMTARSQDGLTSYLFGLDPHGTPTTFGDDTWMRFELADGLNLQYIFDVSTDAFGRVWLTGYPYASGPVVQMLDLHGTFGDKTDDAWVSYPFPLSSQSAKIFLEPAGNLWLSDSNGGLYALDLHGTLQDSSDDTWVTPTGPEGQVFTKSGLMAVDKNGRIWIRYPQNFYRSQEDPYPGLLVLDANGTLADTSDDRWVKFTLSDGLQTGSVSSVSFGPNYFWISDGPYLLRVYDRGTLFDKSDDVWEGYSNRTGILFNGGRLLNTPDRLWWMSGRGFSLFSPNSQVLGSVFDGGQPLVQVEVRTDQGQQTLTDNRGVYSLSLSPGTYTLSAIVPGRTFSPSQQTITVAGQDIVLDPFYAGPVPRAPWALLFYFAGDNNLDTSYVPIFNQLEAAAANTGVRVLVFWDRAGQGDGAYYWVQPDSDLTQLAAYVEGENRWSQPEPDMGDPQTLVGFVSWAKQAFPAENVALVLSDHGSGLAGGMVDETGGPSLMSLSEMESALSAITNQGAEKLDVLYMDACLMGMLEDAYQFRSFARYYVASQYIQWAYSQPYAAYVSQVTAASTPAQVAQSFANAYAEVDPLNPYTMSVGDLEALNPLVVHTNLFAQALWEHMPEAAPAITAARQAVQRYDMDGDGQISAADSYVDLYHLAELVQANTQLLEIKTAAQNVMDAVNQYILLNLHSRSLEGAHNLSHSHGV
ncbi:MAG: hypothetical protein EHM70_19010, partial [Chloroflexota bacterium]